MDIGSTSEHLEQSFVVKYCDIKKIPIFAIPNGTNIPSHKGRAKAKKEGLKKGVPDLFIPVPKNGFNGLFIEMKKPKCLKSKAGTVSKEQREWLNLLSLNGYKSVVCVGSDVAIGVIDEYFRCDD